MCDMEDEIDWSDGTLATPPPLTTGSSMQITAAYTAEPVNDLGLTGRAKSPGLPAHLQNIISGNCATSNAVPQNPPTFASNGYQPTAPSDHDMSRFALYQANQKTYEANFLKRFIMHALHPQTLDLQNSLADNPGVRNVLEDYLQSVTENVDKLTDKMIWNAQFKSVNFLAAGRDISLPFVNLDRQEDVFDGFGPQHVYSVADRMNQSWHRTNSRLNMVQYSADDYPVKSSDGKGRSPLDELQEACRALSYVSRDSGMPEGRIFEFPSGQSRGNNSVGNAGTVGRNDIVAKQRLPVIQSGRRGSNRRVYQKKGSTLQKGSPVKIDKNRISSSPPTAIEVLHEMKSVLPAHNLSRLEALVAYSEPTPSTTDSSAHENWATKIHQVQKDRLALKRNNAVGRGKARQGIKSIVTWAVSNSILKRPSPRVQSHIDRCASRSRVQQTTPRSPTAASQNRGKRKNRQASGSRKKKLRSGLDVIPVLEDPGKDHTPPSSQSRSAQSGTGSEVDATSKCNDETSFPPHPSGSTTLEPHQVLPPQAYFEKRHEDEKLAWRCGIKHALGHYYIAGDRNSCPGCTQSMATSKQTKMMDFYLPSKQYFTQPDPNIIWKPYRGSNKERKGKAVSHNMVAKDAYWAAIESGQNSEDALRAAVTAIQDHLERKALAEAEAEEPPELHPELGPEREPTPEPAHTSEPEPELEPIQPHPSGSKTMEQDQDIPNCHYFSKKDRHEEFAWRCDGGHALGRYYMAGDKRSCPGCGSSKVGGVKRMEMDFYMPTGTAIFQDTPGLVSWGPRKPNNRKVTSTKPKKTRKCTQRSHNQLCSMNYWKAIDKGLEHRDALQMAIDETIDYIDSVNAQNEPDASEGAESDAELQPKEHGNAIDAGLGEGQDDRLDDGPDGLVDGLEDDEMVGIEGPSMHSQPGAEDLTGAYVFGKWGQTADMATGETAALSISDDSTDDDTPSSGSDSE